jgi:O-antigen ligase
VVLVLVTSWALAGNRFAELSSASAVMTDEQAPVKSSSAGRVMVWQTSLEIIGSHPFGVGTGDVVPELMRRYDRDGLTYASERRLNPHNQWLQAGVAFGWPGIFVLTMALLAGLIQAWRIGSGGLMLCVLLVMLHAGVESVLEVQRGVVFIMWMLMVQWPVNGQALRRP